MGSVTEQTAVARELTIAARPETVWEFLVDPEKATRWMGIDATLEPEPGGTYRVTVLSGNVASGQFVDSQIFDVDAIEARGADEI